MSNHNLVYFIVSLFTLYTCSEHYTYELVCFKVPTGDSPWLLLVGFSGFLFTLTSETDLRNLTSDTRGSWVTGVVKVMVCTLSGAISEVVGGWASSLVGDNDVLGELPLTLSGGRGLDSSSTLSDSFRDKYNWLKTLNNKISNSLYNYNLNIQCIK